MKKTLVLVAALMTAALVSQARSDDYPSRVITIVTPTGPGGPTDILARIVADKLSSALKSIVIVENVPGASGLIGSSKVAKAAPDGYTLLMGNLGTHVLSMEARKIASGDMAYDPLKAFAPVALVAKDYFLVVTNRNVPSGSLKAFADYLRSKKGDAAFGSTGPGSLPHVGCELLMQMLKTEARHIPYRGVPPAVQDVIRGDLDFFCNLPGPARGLVEDGSIKALVFAGPNRSELYPDVRTVKEEGLPEFELNIWNALFAPAGTPDAVVAKLNGAVRELFQDSAARKKLIDLGAVIPQPDEQSPAALGSMVASDAKRWPDFLKSLLAAK